MLIALCFSSVFPAMLYALSLPKAETKYTLFSAVASEPDMVLGLQKINIDADDADIDVDLEPDIDIDGDDGDGDDVDVELELDVGVSTNVDVDIIRS